MTEVIEAYPLTWPVNRPRTKWTSPSRFRTPLGAAIKEVQAEVERLGGSRLIISSNLPLRRDGLPYANSSQPGDRGVAVYFTYKKRPMCFACDRWAKVEENMWAIAKTIDALRGIERWGSGQMVEQAFTGFVALPAPEQPWQVLGVSSHATRAEIEEAHSRLAMKHHPDRGGDTNTMARINAARDDLLQRLQNNGGEQRGV
jgi:DnaJ-like protein